MSNAIEFDHVSKQYRLGLVSTKTLSHDIHRWWVTSVLGKEDPYLKIGETNDRASKGNSEYVWALRDITFNVEQGDVVGIIGKNGAGKSTLLKLLSRVTGPTTGQIRAHGRIGSLLEVGTGFHGEMTGRENIYMNGAILGMTKSEIDRKLDEIIDFSGCERYIDTPVKRYSSGMTVRLGFAVAAFLEPEILVVDEVLAVGDAEFQKKAIGKMQDVASDGRTVLFVSHNMASIRKLCKHGVVLENGMAKFMGTADDCVDYYIGTNIVEFVNHRTNFHGFRAKSNITKEFEYDEVQMLNDVEHVSNEEPLRFRVRFHRNNASIKKCQFGVVVKSTADTAPCACYTQPIELPDLQQEFDCEICVPFHHLTPGAYSVNMNISMNDYSAIIRDYDLLYNVLSFNLEYVDAAHKKLFTMWQLSTNCAIMEGTAKLL